MAVPLVTLNRALWFRPMTLLVCEESRVPPSSSPSLVVMPQASHPFPVIFANPSVFRRKTPLAPPPTPPSESCRVNTEPPLPTIICDPPVGPTEIEPLVTKSDELPLTITRLEEPALSPETRLNVVIIVLLFVSVRLSAWRMPPWGLG